MFDLPSMFDAIGDAIQDALFVDATWTPKGGQPVPVRVGFQAPHIAVDALGVPVNAVQAYASGLVTTFSNAKAGDVLTIAGNRWSLKTAPLPFGGANLCRIELSGPLKS